MSVISLGRSNCAGRCTVSSIAELELQPNRNNIFSIADRKKNLIVLEGYVVKESEFLMRIGDSSVKNNVAWTPKTV
jgi:hypothetical protein